MTTQTIATTTIETLIETLKNLCARSEGGWEDAAENARGGRRLEIAEAEEECIDHWVDAIQALQQHGYCGAAAAVESLKAASAIAWHYGSNQSEEEGLAVVTASIQASHDTFLEIDASYTPIDVGWDLRLHPDTQIALPSGTHICVRYMDGDQERVAEGGPSEVASVMRKAGYRVRA